MSVIVPTLKRVIRRVAVCLLLGCNAGYAQGKNSSADGFATLGDRFRYYVHRTYTSRQRLAFLLADTGLGHALNDPEEWGQEPHTYGLRLASNLGRRAVANSIEFGLGAVLDEDTRYKTSQLHGIRQRVRYATVAAFTARVPGGRRRLAYSRFGATAGGVLASSMWHPKPASASDLLQGIGFGVLNRVPDNLLDEFSPDMRNVGKKAWRTIRRR